MCTQTNCGPAPFLIGAFALDDGSVIRTLLIIEGIAGIGQLAIGGERHQIVRRQPNARTGIAHMVGLGSVCHAHALPWD